MASPGIKVFYRQPLAVAFMSHAGKRRPQKDMPRIAFELSVQHYVKQARTAYAASLVLTACATIIVLVQLNSFVSLFLLQRIKAARKSYHHKPAV